MSGGVDSAVAAARLVDAGHEVVGVTLHLWDYPETGAGSHGRCCAPEDQYDARRTADALGIPHYTFDRRELFARTVVEPFVDAYVAGETPSPCAACNRGVKIAELVALADRLGAARVATGHYARMGRTDDGVPFIREGHDGTKDQSYFLYATTLPHLERLVFPLGESTKAEVRAEALARKVPGATKGESQELCFVGAGAGAYATFVEERAKPRLRPGPIVDRDGRRVGMHDGVHRFTVGQRKGLGVALGRPAFVTAIDPATATVHLGDEDDLAATSARIEDVVVAPGVELPREARIRVRYRHEGASGHVSADAIAFHEPVRAVSRGQVAVFYDGDRVLGGARIC
ncbi:MAG: tRNA 2-thiouridine(34) synthase MnmA [Labilithrix sp.]|nr:tRNA 2-thiouridine(34) synthase MnmA [Labilithrix sp.]MCW5813523.1 tRNA 2-thiouridine(34) synthase MnmA [Labilithrix sp.]